MQQRLSGRVNTTHLSSQVSHSCALSNLLCTVAFCIVCVCVDVCVRACGGANAVLGVLHGGDLCTVQSLKIIFD